MLKYSISYRSENNFIFFVFVLILKHELFYQEKSTERMLFGN